MDRHGAGHAPGPGSRLLLGPPLWDTREDNFTSTLDIEAIMAPPSHQPPAPPPAPSLQEAWGPQDKGPPVLVPESRGEGPPLLQAMDEESSSSEEDSEEEERRSGASSEEESGSSSSSCSSLDTESSSDNEEELLQRSRTKAKRLSGSRSQLSPKPRPKSMSQQLPSQSCPSPSPPPVLVKQLDPAPAPALETSRQHHRSGSSHRSRKDHGSSGRRPGSGLEGGLVKRSTPVTHKKDLSSIITQDQETLSGSDKEEVSITNNLHGILLKKRETPNFAKSCKISKIYSGRLPGAGDKSFSKKKQMNTFRSSNCDSNICDNSREYDSMPTLHNYTDGISIPDLPPLRLDANTRTFSDTKDITDDTDDDDDSDCMILDSEPRARPHSAQGALSSYSDDANVAEDTESKHKHNLKSGLHGKIGASTRAPHLSHIADQQVGTPPRLSDDSNSEQSEEEFSGSGSDTSSSSSSCSDTAAAASQVPAVSTGTSAMICDSRDSSSDSSSEADSLPPPLLEPQVPEVKKKKSRENIMTTNRSKKQRGSKSKTLQNNQKVSCGIQTEETAFSYSPVPALPPLSPSSSTSSSQTNLVEQDSHASLASAPPLLYGFGSQKIKHNRGRPRKNPPTLQPETSYEAAEPCDTEEGVSDDNSADDTSEEVEKKAKRGKLSVLFAAAKHWQRTQESKKSEEASVYEFTDDTVSEKITCNSSDDDDDDPRLNCDNKHSKAMSFHDKKSKPKKVMKATPENLPKFKRVNYFNLGKNEKGKKFQRKIPISSDDDMDTEVSSNHTIRSSNRPRSRSSTFSNQADSFKQDSDSGAKGFFKHHPAGSDTSSCVEDTVPKREKKQNSEEQKPVPLVYQQFSTKVSNNFGKTSGLIFSKKYCTLRPDAFWKKSKRHLSIDEGFRELSEVKQETLSSSVVATKASLKEMPNVPRNQVQQMINVLASSTRIHSSKSAKSKKKEERQDFRNELAYETQSEDEDSTTGRSRRNKKGWKSKHKNVVDPVFLGELEHLIRDIATVQLEVKLSKDFWPDRPSDSVPSIFKRRKIFTVKRKGEFNKIAKRGKTSKHSDNNTIEIFDLTNESDEQRLPLKKRHHHLQGGGGEESVDMNASFEDIDMEPMIPTQGLIQIKTPEKICREFRNSNIKKQADICYPGEKKSGTGIKILQDKLIKKPTAADRIVEKLGIQIKKENSTCGSSNDSRGSMRRINKDQETGGFNILPHANSSKEMRTKQCKTPYLMVKSDSKLKDSVRGDSDSLTFVDNIQGCIEKYTAGTLEKTKLNDPSFPNHLGKSGHENKKYLQQQERKTNSRNLAEAPYDKTYSPKSYVPIFSSPEPDVSISGRESSLSQSSNSSDCCVINLEADQADKAAPGPGSRRGSSSKLGRSTSSRQDLHSHLWRHEGARTQEQETAAPRTPAARAGDTSQLPNISSFCGTPGSGPAPAVEAGLKPLPTEPIRRVDLGPLGSFCSKPGPVFLGAAGHECLIRKVPQAIVAPFRRAPPESSLAPAAAPVPIHRASIAHSEVTTSSSAARTTEPGDSAEASSHLPPSEDSQTRPILSPSEDQKQVRRSELSKIRKCEVAVERLRQDTVSGSPPAVPGVAPAPETSAHPALAPAVAGEIGEKSQPILNIATRDKTTKENKCSSKTLGNVISKKKGDDNNYSQDGKSSEEEKFVETNLEDKTTSPTKKSLLVTNDESENISPPKQPLTDAVAEEVRGKSKKRRRKANKTGFPCKIRKKKKTFPAAEHDEWSESPQAAASPSPRSASPAATLSNLLPATAPPSGQAKSRKGIFDSYETFKISAANLILESDGRPTRRCRAQADQQEDSEEGGNICRSTNNLPTSASKGKGKRRLQTPDKKVKKPRSSSVTRHKVSSSVEPSPASSDVESVDCRSFLEEEPEPGDTSYLATLPCMEDNLLSPSVAETEHQHTEDRRKKAKQTNIVKKNFLKAGLFSYDYKSERRGGRGSDTNFIKNKGGLLYKPDEHPFSLLPPPYYCGRQLRQKKEDFALPFDLWSLHSTDSLPGRDIVATWNYKRVKTNIYVDVKLPNNHETPACHCKQPTEPGKPCCGNKCLNRMTFTECDPESCPLVDRCSNMVIQKQKSSVVVQRFMTHEKGWGIRTKTHISPGTFIMEYLGEVVTDKEFKRRMQTDYQKDSHHYCLHVGEGLVIDGYRVGGECRFVNHSCNPNCEMQKWSVNGVWRMALFSKVAIDVNEELSYDYNFSWFNTHEGQSCHCGSQECRGFIGGKGKKLLGQKSSSSSSKSGKTKEDSKSSSKHDLLNKDVKFTRHQKSEKGMDLKSKNNVELLNRSSMSHFAALKPMTSVQQQFCRKHHVLLLRNLEKIRKLRDLYFKRGKFPSSECSTEQRSSKPGPSPPSSSGPASEPSGANISSTELLKAGLSALSSARSVQTRRLACAQENPDISKVVQIAKVFQEIIENFKDILDLDENGQSMVEHFMRLPSKEDLPQYYYKISEPIDLSSIKMNLKSGSYHSVAQIDQDILLLFQNNIRFYGSSHPTGKMAHKLRSKYITLCTDHRGPLADLVGEAEVRCLARGGAAAGEGEDVINCGCEQFRDEGVMVQCDACSCWQHTDCVNPDPGAELPDTWTCDQCSAGPGAQPRARDIALVPQPEFASSGETYNVAMVREDGMKLVLGMTVYVLRAFKESSAGDSRAVRSNQETSEEAAGKITVGHGGVPHKSISPIKGPSKEAASLLPGNYPTYKTVSADLVSTQDMDIFRVERLWINEAGKKFAFGYHYLRPHETFHEPSRKFFDNEVFRVPLYEVLPIDTIWKQCWVMDPATFCRGRPNEAREEHVYICEYRVDKTARLFNKISKHKHPTCTKFYAFTDFDLRLRLTRSYTPHQVPATKTAAQKGAKSSNKLSSDASRGVKDGSLDNQGGQRKKLKHKKVSQKSSTKFRVAASIDTVSTNLLSSLQDDNPLDATSLLEGMRRKRTKPNNFNIA